MKNHPSFTDTFQIISQYYQINFSLFLRQILAEKKLSITELYRQLSNRGYSISLESLYRYFNPSQRSHRFPSREFIQIFSEIIQLTPEETHILLLFWKHWQFCKKHRSF